MNTPRPVTIIGGGLAGLTLGIGLRQRGVPVLIREAGVYPRHRVCGEFICGRGQEVLSRLGLDTLVHQAGVVRARTAAFFAGNAASPVRHFTQPAWCLSRFVLDAALATRFRECGGELRESDRTRDETFGEGTVRACGRRSQPVEGSWRWFGLRIHARNVPVMADLEMHAQPAGYVGICRLPAGEFNICGLFRRPAKASDSVTGTREHLRGEPGTSLWARLANADLDTASFCSVAALSLQPQRARDRIECCVGDALTMVPPVTGNGMSMAFEAAELALGPLAAWSRGELSWNQARELAAHACDRAFARRLLWARWLQWMMFAPAFAGGLGQLALRSDWLWRLLFARTR
jgi:2-polyprenyl-6-methoxyphenol hydroxylase-like FAD-dependent oxidoreductase